MEGGREISRDRGRARGGRVCGYAGMHGCRKTGVRAWRRALLVRGLGSGYGIPPGAPSRGRGGVGRLLARGLPVCGYAWVSQNRGARRERVPCSLVGWSGGFAPTPHTPLVLARSWAAGQSHFLYMEMLLLSPTLARAPTQLTQPSWRPPPWPPWAWRCRASCAWGGRPSTCKRARRARGASTQSSSWRSRCQSPCAT